MKCAAPEEGSSSPDSVVRLVQAGSFLLILILLEEPWTRFESDHGVIDATLGVTPTGAVWMDFILPACAVALLWLLWTWAAGRSAIFIPSAAGTGVIGITLHQLVTVPGHADFRLGTASVRWPVWVTAALAAMALASTSFLANRQAKSQPQTGSWPHRDLGLRVGSSSTAIGFGTVGVGTLVPWNHAHPFHHFDTRSLDTLSFPYAAVLLVATIVGFGISVARLRGHRLVAEPLEVAVGILVAAVGYLFLDGASRGFISPAGGFWLMISGTVIALGGAITYRQRHRTATTNSLCSSSFAVQLPVR